MKNIFSSTNYREYLKDVYHDRKQKNPAYSYQMLADKAGFKSKSFIPHVLEGKKNLSDDSMAGIARAFSIKEDEFDYFKLLVQFNQAVSNEEKRRFLSLCLQFQSRSRQHTLLKDKYELFSHWYHTIILEIITGEGFAGDFKTLARTLVPRISVKEARDSIKLLMSLGLVELDASGIYRSTKRMLSTGDEVSSLAIADFHKQCFELSAQSIDTCDAAQRDISCLIGALSPVGFELIKSEIQLFRKRLMGIIDQDTSPQKVFLVNFQLVPVTADPDTLVEGAQ